MTGFNTVPTRPHSKTNRNKLDQHTAIHGGQLGLMLTSKQTKEAIESPDGSELPLPAPGGGGRSNSTDFQHGMHRGRLTGAGGAGAASGKVRPLRAEAAWRFGAEGG
jgi:hypothetical protein